MISLYDLASILRSKNAGPLFLTFDVMFDKRENYERARDSGCITAEAVAAMYHCDPAKVEVYMYDIVDSIKITIPRATVNGDLTDDDVYGAQQHVPLGNIMIK